MSTQTVAVDEFDDTNVPRYERMTRAEVDEELAKWGGDPQETVERVKALIEQRLGTPRRTPRRR